MLIGYARVSTQDQNLNLQQDALDKVGCEKTFTDIVSGVQTDRSGLQEALAYCREGDTLVVWKLDRLGRSLQHLIETVQELQKRGIGFKSLQESIDTTTSGGKLIFHVFCHFPPHNVPGVFTQIVPPVFTQTVPGDGKLLQQRLPLGYRKHSPFYEPEEETCQAGDCPPWIFAPYCCKYAATPVTAP